VERDLVAHDGFWARIPSATKLPRAYCSPKKSHLGPTN
jgi:hypothetical protein